MDQSMKAFHLPETDITGLTVFSVPRDIRRDLHLYVDYVRRHDIKRKPRSNSLPKPDLKKLMTLMPLPEIIRLKKGGYEYDEYEDDPNGWWVGLIDHLAWVVGFVKYSYSSARRNRTSTYGMSDNYITVDDARYDAFLRLSVAEQEQFLVKALVDPYSTQDNELVAGNTLGILDKFYSSYSITSLSVIDFAGVRRFLLDLLAGLEPGKWYRTADLVAYLKVQHPYFLIPEIISMGEGRRKTQVPRYQGFSDSGRERLETAPDAFERVEGRFVERFLEGIPLELGYIAVAYQPLTPDMMRERPLRGVLQSFRVHERLRAAHQNTIPAPVITVQPNFEVYVESLIYPAAVMYPLLLLTDTLSEGVTSVLRLNRQKIAAYAAKNPGVDVVNLLRGLVGRELPQNVAIELREWEGQADTFVLYDGFSLVEGQVTLPDSLEIKPTLHLVRDAEAALKQLYAARHVPLRVTHPDTALMLLPEEAETCLPKRSTEPLAAVPAVVLKRENWLALHVPTEALLNQLRSELVGLRCPVLTDRDARLLLLPMRFKLQLATVINQLQTTYQIRLEDIE